MENQTTTVSRVGFSTRLAAWFLDIVLICAISFVLAPVLGGFLGAASAAAANDGSVDPNVAAAAGGIVGTLMALVVVLPLITVVYYVLEGLTGLTLGKLIVGIRVASAEGSMATTPTLLTRWAVKSSYSIFVILGAILSLSFLTTIGNIVSLIVFVGCFFVLGANKQALHDIIAKTAVYKKADIA